MVPRIPCCDTHNQPFRREVTNWSASPLCKAAQLISFVSGLLGLGTELWAMPAHISWLTHLLSASITMHAIGPESASKAKLAKKKTPTYLQVFRLTWLNVSALSRRGMALGTAPVDRSGWWQPSRGAMSGRKGLVQEALHSSCSGSSITRWTQPLGSDGAKTSSMFQLFLAHHGRSSMHLSLSSPLSPHDHHTRTEHTRHSWSALSTGIRAIHIGRKNNGPFSFFIHMDEELVQLTLLWKNGVFSEEYWFCF